jgi:hypothetical protein
MPPADQQYPTWVTETPHAIALGVPPTLILARGSETATGIGSVLYDDQQLATPAGDNAQTVTPASLCANDE